MLRFVVYCLMLMVTAPAVGQDYALEQAAIRRAVRAVAGSVVQIRTVGGFERVGDTQIVQGPTTGLIVSADGYIVSSAFNFAQRPSSILISLGSGPQVPAVLVARDLNRMLVLLKIETDKPLTVPTAVPRSEMAVGQRAIAMGRTFQADQVDVSVGIISGTNRMHGRAIQTDCNVSTANYGGPLVDLHGRVFGLLVPMSPQAGGDDLENEVAGTEFYDSGIGFAVPLEDVFGILERWKQGDDLMPGKLGVSMKPGSGIVEPPTIVSVWPNGPAAHADWKAGDRIVAVNGKAVSTQNELQFFTHSHYAGDQLTFSLRRSTGDSAEEFDSDITLVAKLPPYRPAFLGIMPARPSPEEEDGPTGIEVVRVWPNSPADDAGLQQGDCITTLNTTKTRHLAAALEAMQAVQPDEDFEIEVARDDDEVTLTATAGHVPEEILTAAELGISPISDPGEPRELETIKLPQFPQEARSLAPAEKPAVPGLVIWLAATDDEQQAVARAWQPICDRDGIVLLIARPADGAVWQFEDLEYLDQLSRTAKARFTADPQRTIIAGSGKGGQLAYALGLRRRTNFSGIVADDAPLPRTLKVPENTPGGQLAVLSIVPARSPLAPLVRDNVEQLREAGYPVSVEERAPTEGNVPPVDVFLGTISRWLAGLQRL